MLQFYIFCAPATEHTYIHTYLRSKTNDMILKNSSKLIEIDKNLIKSINFVSKVISSTFKTSYWLLKNDS